ncbi:MAG: [FeFe] hydrogenase H-cluster radical SAM maturase HydG [Candidatus Margulisbacteria bacterium]|nr:[FeFe] hydrogenase H-cluster radical SAM maturase HydG [Candidatus Margulisiibacteriota bacterium]
MISFIDDRKINAILAKAGSASASAASAIIDKALGLKGLAPEEAAVLLQCDSPAVVGKLFKAARRIKETIYGKRLVIFAPLYVTNICVNNCLYCGFRCTNKLLERKRLSLEEIKEEVTILERQGHKRILLEAGEDPKGDINYLEKAIKTIYATKYKNGEIRRLNVNAPAMSVKDFKRLKKSKIGTYQLFQETYHRGTYEKMHLSGPKSDYLYHLFAMHRAQEAGIDDVGIGVLFGLHDYRFEVLALLYHALELEKQFGVGPHTISVPRIEPAVNSPLTVKPPAPVSDNDFKKLVAILRLAVPYTGLILSTRESAKMRNEVIGLGISQISAGSSTVPGGYKKSLKKSSAGGQFSISDNRTLAEVIHDISKLGYSPSFCTACYRLGRVGADFMDMAKPGLIKNFCLPNSLLTFKEYLLDYGNEKAKKLGKAVIKAHLKDIPSSAIRKQTIGKLKTIEQGQRDLYF